MNTRTHDRPHRLAYSEQRQHWTPREHCKPHRDVDTTRKFNPDEHLGLLKKEVSRYAKLAGCDFDDLIGPAYQVLLRAACTFDPAAGCRVSTHIVAALRFRLPNLLRSEVLGMQRRKQVWIGAVAASESMHTDWGCPVAEDRQKSRGMTEYEQSIFTELEAFACTSKHGWHVLRLRCQGFTLDQIGISLGLSRERVRQIGDRLGITDVFRDRAG